MPVSNRIDQSEKVIYTTFEGEITDQQIVQHAARMLRDPEIDSSFVELIHSKTSSVKGFTSSGARAIADVLKDSSGPGKIGVVASEDVEFGLARMIELLADESPIEIQVFRDQADARSWLGIE